VRRPSATPGAALAIRLNPSPARCTIAPRMRPSPPASLPSSLAVALLLVTPGLLVGACILDFGDLAGGTTSSGSAGGIHVGGGGSGGGAIDASTGTCPPLECAACPPECADGGCGPTPLAAGADAKRPWAVALMDDGVYWVNNGGNDVLRRTTGSDAPERLTKTLVPTAIAAAAGFVVWAAQDGLWGCPADACNAGKKKISGSIGPGSIEGVAYDGTTVYFTDRGDANVKGKVLRCAPDACNAPFEIASDQLSPRGITVHGDTLFWTDSGDGTNNGNVYKVPKGGAGYTQVAGPLVLPTSIVADDTHVYFNRWAGDGKVFRCPHVPDFCAAPELIAPAADPLALPFDLALADGRIYWSNTGDGTIVSCPVAGCAQDLPLVHASGRENLRRIAVGTSCLFWVDDTLGGAVFEIPR
jgi:hypothetical protein